jgi:hypothetical protein
MNKESNIKIITFIIIISFILSIFSSVSGIYNENKHIEININFSNPEILTYDNNIIIRVFEQDFSRMEPGMPVIPYVLYEYYLDFGSEIINVEYETSNPILYNLSKTISKASFPAIDKNNIILDNNFNTQKNIEPYPVDWVYYHTGGGLLKNNHTTFFTIRIYPIKYFENENQIEFIENITIDITYREPDNPILIDPEIYDLLILTPSKYENLLIPLIEHKNNFGFNTKLVTLDKVYEEMYWHGRDTQEKIKYFIKESIEKWGITNVLLIGGLNGQKSTWDFPIRYSRVVPPDEQEYAEQSFISDIYYADIYNSLGEFSSWDSNKDDIFSVWNETFKEEMDLYPDVYLGRIPCRNSNEVKIMVDKIIKYEEQKCDDQWFKNLLLVAGDSYNDTAHFNEGELISEKAIELMPEFQPVKVYASEQDINRKTVNSAMNQGSGFAYFCGHGSPASWSTHFPPDGNIWTTGYNINDMIFLRNKEKMPITVVGGCHNGKFDVTLMNIIKGIREYGLREYFFQPPFRFYYNEWVPNCWAWWLTSKANGGAIATIANTGLGTHGEGDSDYNLIADYLEVLDGWLELRFLQLYGEENRDFLGENHGDTLSGYLNRFLGDNAKMDVKMVQQWGLFGDPSLKIGGYSQ